MDLACSLINYYNGDASFLAASFFAMFGGCILGWLAIIFGISDLLNVYQNKPDAMKKALIHGGINSTVVVLYTLLAFMQYKNYPSLEADGPLILSGKGLIIAFMIVGNFVGGSLVIKHKVSVE